MKNKSLYFWIIVLIMIDQFSKIITNNFYLDKNVSIISNLVYYRPHLNTDYSWINSLFNFGIGFWGHIIPLVIVLIIMLIAFDYIYYNGKNSKLTDFIFVFLLSGTVCSLVDKVFWGGSLDFIYLKSLFTFDIKDCYITVGGEILMLYAFIKYWRAINEFKEIHLIQHCKKRIAH